MSVLIPVQLACLDMAGTTVIDDGVVEAAFTVAIASVGIAGDDPAYPRALAYVRTTMGQSKRDVFGVLTGDDERADAATAAFERAYSGLVHDRGLVEVPGATRLFARLRDAGIKVALTTGFSAATQKTIIDVLGWGDAVDLALCPADAGRGRPYPDMVLTAVLRLGVTDVRAVAVAGDTASDVETGRRAGAGIVAGVLTGAHDAATLTAAGATHVLSSVIDLENLLLHG